MRKTTRGGVWVIAALLLAVALQTASVVAQEAASKPPVDKQADKKEFGTSGTPNTNGKIPPAIDPAVEARMARLLRSPRSTFESLIKLVDEGERNDATICLDLSEVPANIVSVVGPETALHLRNILARMWKINYDKLPDDPNTPSPYVFGKDTNINTELPLFTWGDAARIQLVRNDKGYWQFSPETVDQVDGLWERWRDRPVQSKRLAAKEKMLFADRLQSWFPESLHGTTFLLKNYQWICLLILIFIGFVADVVSRFLLHRLAATWFRVFRSNDQYDAQHGVFRPMGLLVQALVWYVGTTLIGLPDSMLWILLLGLKFFTVVAAVWSAYRVIDLVALELSEKARRTSTKFDDLLIPLVSRSLKVMALVVGTLACAEAFNLPITGLLGGLGIGGAALALASKDTISNLFGSFTVLVDRPFEMGDWIVTGDVEGTVETVGFRSTRIRTFYNSLITLPNSLLTTAVVDNMGRRRYRRMKQMISLQYDTTPEQVEAFCEGVRELLRRHPYTRKDYYHVYLNEFSASSIDVLLYVFFECPDWNIELRERHRLMVDIMRLAQQLGCSFAFPTRTLHVHNEADSDATPQSLDDPLYNGQAAAAQIAGPYQSPEDRPGGVRFTGPTKIKEVDVPQNGEGARR